MTAIEDDRAARPPRIALYRNPRARSVLVQALFVFLLFWLGWELVANARSNLAAKGVVSGFGFLDQSAGFDVSQALINYSPTDSYRRLYLVGLLNTLLVAVLGIILATILGFVIGIARLSGNWLVARIAGGYVELIRNLPLLFQLLFWYLAVLGTLPATRESISLSGAVFLNNRGVVLPRPILGDGIGLGGAGFVHRPGCGLGAAALGEEAAGGNRENAADLLAGTGTGDRAATCCPGGHRISHPV